LIRFRDLRPQYAATQAEIASAVADFLESGHYILGSGLQEFEDRFAGYVGAEHCVGVASGLDALHLLLRAYEVGPGDEVIVPSNTYIATWLAVTHVGAIPVPVEPVPETYNLDPGRVEEAITSRTKVVLPVHLYGQPADIDPLGALAEAHDLIVVEDAAQAHGARYRGRRTGSLGHAAAFSFYPSKNLGAYGDGGAITTNDPKIAERVRLLRNYGSSSKYRNEVAGYNSRLDELQARLLLVNLRHLDGWNEQRRRQAAIYLRELRDTELILPEQPEWAEVVWHLFVVRASSRDDLGRHLGEAGIETMIHYPVPPHLQPAYEDLGMRRGSLPVSEEIHDTVLSLPIGPHLADDDVLTVAGAMRGYFSG
jgi:dTDP-4-amino-4,6-dideoxygalactose transaminase